MLSEEARTEWSERSGQQEGAEAARKDRAPPSAQTGDWVTLSFCTRAFVLLPYSFILVELEGCVCVSVYVRSSQRHVLFHRQTQTVTVNLIRRRSSSRMSLVRKKENYGGRFSFRDVMSSFSIKQAGGSAGFRLDHKSVSICGCF